MIYLLIIYLFVNFDITTFCFLFFTFILFGYLYLSISEFQQYKIQKINYNIIIDSLHYKILYQSLPINIFEVFYLLLIF